jgi:hypothetical protein
VIVEHPEGRAMILVPGDVLLATPGHRESTRWVVGTVPAEGLTPGGEYWILAGSGVVGELIGSSPRTKTHLGRVRFLGALVDKRGRSLNIRHNAATASGTLSNRSIPVYLVLGTAAEVGKTTAGLAVLGSLKAKGYTSITALKATGTSSVVELLAYQDVGAVQTFDCVDFGLPTTYPSSRDDIEPVFERALDVCLQEPTEALVIECGGDILGANVPVFLQCLRRRQLPFSAVLVAADALAAYGAKSVLADWGISVDLITGPCSDTPTLLERTSALCGTVTINLLGRLSLGTDIAP